MWASPWRCQRPKPLVGTCLASVSHPFVGSSPLRLGVLSKAAESGDRVAQASRSPIQLVRGSRRCPHRDSLNSGGGHDDRCCWEGLLFIQCLTREQKRRFGKTLIILESAIVGPRAGFPTLGPAGLQGLADLYVMWVFLCPVGR